MRLDAKDFPRDFDGNIVACSWFISIPHVVNWMMRVIEEKNFTPRNDPREMTPLLAQQGIANVLCPRRSWATSGIAVNYQQTRKTTTASHCVLYFTEPINWQRIQNMVYGAHFGPSLTSAYDLNRFLERGGKFKTVIGPIWRQGTPIGDNVALVEREKKRREEEERKRAEANVLRQQSLAEKLAESQVAQGSNYTTEVVWSREEWTGNKPST